MRIYCGNIWCVFLILTWSCPSLPFIFHFPSPASFHSDCHTACQQCSWHYRKWRYLIFFFSFLLCNNASCFHCETFQQNLTNLHWPASLWQGSTCPLNSPWLLGPRTQHTALPLTSWLTSGTSSCNWTSFPTCKTGMSLFSFSAEH